MFPSLFWKTLWKLLGTKLMFNTSYHPQINGQKEITNKTVKNHTRNFFHRKETILGTPVNGNLKDYNEQLTNAEFSCHSLTTKFFAFEYVCGVNPLSLVVLLELPKQNKQNNLGYIKMSSIKLNTIEIHKQMQQNIIQANC